MKKLSAFFVTFFTVATLFAAARPSLDGRALVAQAGSMPRGLFARTVGYLPGDSVTVTNPLNGSVVDVLILGAIDPSEGVAILLSPEAATQLGIVEDSNVQVKITKRTGRLDETVSGAAILANDAPSSNENATPEKNPEPVAPPPVASSPAPVVQEPPVEKKPAPVKEPENAEFVANPPEVVVAEPVAEPVPPEPVNPPAPVAEKVEAIEETPFEPITDEGALASEPAKPTFDPSGVEKIVFLDAPGDPNAPITTENNENVKEEVFVAEDEFDDSEDELMYEDDFLEEEIAAIIGDNKEDEVIEEVAEEKSEEEPEAKPEEKPEVKPAEEEKAVATVEETSEYSPIVLQPVGDNPPPYEVPKKPEVEVEPPAPAPEPEPTPAPVVVTPAPAPIPEPAPAPEPKPEPDWKKHIVPSLSDLQSGKYYVQILTLRDEANIESTIEKFGKNYPIVLVPLASGTAYQVMIGALNIDEYGAVMEHFRANGYKDLFLRKVK